MPLRALFGAPFFAAGVSVLLTAAGALPMADEGDLGAWARPLLGLMGLAFTGVGGGLLFGRRWTILDRTEQAAVTSWGLLVPLHERTRPLAEFSRVSIGFDPGDSDSSERFPVTLRARSGPDFVLCSPTGYDEARACAVEAARHLAFTLEDATGDHAVAVEPADADQSLQRRAAHEAHPAPVNRPAALRSEVHRETHGLRVVIPHPSMSPWSLVLVLVPISLLLAFGPSLSGFFDQTSTPTFIGLAFLAMLALMFGVLPIIALANGYLRARNGYTEVRASADTLVVRERGAWRTHTIASLDAADILDVDIGTRGTGAASARRAVERKRMDAGHEPASLSPRMERWLAAAARRTKGRGVIVKSRRGLTTFGQELDDEEIRYLADVVRYAVVARRG